MGIYLSTTAYAPLALVSAVVGFVSFAFTLGTFVKVLWVNFGTFGQSAHEVHASLTNLRTELLEERASIRTMRKQCRKRQRMIQKGQLDPEFVHKIEGRPEQDDATLKTMGDAVKHLIRRFEDVERPFLLPGEEGIAHALRHRKRRRDSGSASPYDEPYGYASPPPDLEKAGPRGRSRPRHDREPRLPRSTHDADHDADDSFDAFWAQRAQYANYSIGRRIKWLSKKGDAQDLAQALTRAQTRRIALQMTGLTAFVHEYAGPHSDMAEMVRRIDERMSRFVGVRRVDGSGGSGNG